MLTVRLEKWRILDLPWIKEIKGRRGDPHVNVTVGEFRHSPLFPRALIEMGDSTVVMTLFFYFGGDVEIAAARSDIPVMMRGGSKWVEILRRKGLPLPAAGQLKIGEGEFNYCVIYS